MEITFLGGAEEVGKVGISVKTQKDRILLDFGIDVQEMAMPIQPKEMPTDIFLSHPHLDHCGSIPYLFKQGYKGGVWATSMCLDLAELLLADSLKVQKKKGLKPHFSEVDLKKMYRNKRILGYRNGIKLASSTVKFFNAGHLPGSASTLVEADGKRIVFTGDTKFIPTELSPAADSDYKDIDVLITESTYSYKDHPDRPMVVNGLKEHVRTVLESGGIVLLPCFAVGRSQEMMMNLHDMGYPVYLDGMGRKATELIINHPEAVRDIKKLKRAFGAVRKVYRASQRKDILKKPCVIIATAGMLQAGSAVWYAKHLYNNERNAMIFTGYQADGTPGRTVLDTGRLVFDDLDVKPKMDVRYLDFSDHADRGQLLRFFNDVKPKKIIVMHGEHTDNFAKELKAKGFDAAAMKNGETVTV